jgi:hypothetical protein
LTISQKSGTPRTISSLPRNGTNVELAEVGATYEVIKAKFGTDPPHWSSTGA